MKLTITQIKFHRNGITGEPFHAVLFADPAEGEMLSIVFDAKAHVAVFNLERLASGDIGLKCNCWRGDLYEPYLRKALKQLEAVRMQP